VDIIGGKIGPCRWLPAVNRLISALETHARRVFPKFLKNIYCTAMKIE